MGVPGGGDAPTVVALSELPPLPEEAQGAAACASLGPRDLPASYAPATVALIDALERRDAEAVGDALQIRAEPCTRAEGLGGPPKCVDDDPEGTPYEVFRFIDCEGGWVPISSIPEFTQGILEAIGPLAAYGTLDPAEAQALYREGDTLVVFAPAEGLPAIAAVAFVLAGDQIMLTRSGCATIGGLVADKDGQPP